MLNLINDTEKFLDLANMLNVKDLDNAVISSIIDVPVEKVQSLKKDYLNAGKELHDNYIQFLFVCTIYENNDDFNLLEVASNCYFDDINEIPKFMDLLYIPGYPVQKHIWKTIYNILELESSDKLLTDILGELGLSLQMYNYVHGFIDVIKQDISAGSIDHENKKLSLSADAIYSILEKSKELKYIPITRDIIAICANKNDDVECINAETIILNLDSIRAVLDDTERFENLLLDQAK